MTETIPVKENKKSFCKRVRSFATPIETAKIKMAYMVAKYSHRAQKRKELDDNGAQVRYFEHVRRSAIILMDEIGCRDPDTIIATLLHDSLEDCEDMSEQMLEVCFGTRVARMVKTVTKTKYNKESYYTNIAQMSSVEPNVLLIKAADRIDNLRSMTGLSDKFIRKQCDETENKILPLLDSDSVAAHIISAELIKLSEEVLSPLEE